jgi:UDP-N-acetylmuramoylalanine-D-glutamate ligase
MDVEVCMTDILAWQLLDELKRKILAVRGTDGRTTTNVIIVL